jgi:hypothetical protein
VRRARTTARYTPFAFAGFIAAILLCSFEQSPWWVLLAMWLGSLELRITR